LPASSVRPKPSFWRLPPGGWPAVLLLGAWLSWVPSQPAPAQFVYDLSSRLIAITTAFVGTQVLLYGAVEGESSDIVVVIRGPARDTTVRRKSRVGPIWVNTRSLEFRAVPSFYAVAASDRLEDIAGPATLARHELGPGNLRLTPVDATGYGEREIAAFRAALVRNKRRTGLFSIEPGTVAFLGDTLFRTRIVFPANVPPGDYQVQVFQFADGEVVGAQTSTLEISKMGLEAALYEYSLQRPALYGVASIVLALSAGWCANLLFRKV
jgi:uncharacterized protein (TIGR02186 family)